MKKLIFFLGLLCLVSSASAQTQITSGHPVYTTTTGLSIGTQSSPTTLTLSHSTSNTAALRIQRSNSLSDTYTELGTVGGSGRLEAFKGNLSFGADPDNNTTGSLINFKIDNSEVLKILAGGNVGIGYGAPAFKLDVRNGDINLGAGGAYRHEGDAIISKPSSNVIQFGSGNPNQGLRFMAGAAERLTVATNGNVGIGTASPSSILHVSKNHGTQGVPMVNLSSTADGDVLYVKITATGLTCI